jgi:Replication initiation factor
LNELTVISCGVDYLTLTATESASCSSLAMLASGVFRLQRDLGFASKPFGMSGYSGFASGGIQIGRLDHSLLIRLSSNLAHSHWRKFYALADHISRIDVECTTRHRSSPDRRIKRALAEAKRYTTGKKGRLNVGYRWNNKTGETLYLGHRLSNSFGRMYDKGKQSGEEFFDGAVRHEVELHNRSAGFMAAVLYASPSELSQIPGHVSRFFRNRGCSMAGFPEDCPPLMVPRSRSDDERRLAWLRTQVRPSVLALVQAGRLTDVLDALGLGDLAQ